MSKLWQHPYVNMFKHLNIGEWRKCSKEGEVSTVMDKQVKGTVYRITGSIPASNYIQFPRTSTQSLGLTGKFLYILFKPIPSKYFMVHIDVATEDGLAVRISFSNLFKEFKSTSTWVQFPFVANPPPGSVEAATTHGAHIKRLAGTASLSTHWTVLMLDFQYILSVYLNRKYLYLKNVRLCANMFVKGMFTSDMEYEPGLSYEEAKKIGFSTEGMPFPRELAFPFPKGSSWSEFYDFIKFPPDNKQRSLDMISGKKLSPKHSRSAAPPGFISSPPKKESKLILKESNAVRNPPISRNKSRDAVTSRVALVDRLSPKKSSLSKRRQVIPTTLPEVGLDRPVSVLEGDDGEVHVFAHPADEVVVHRHDKQNELEVIEQLLPEPRSVTVKKHAVKQFKSLKPDPILVLKRIVGYGGATFREALWTKNGASVVYPSHAIIVSMEIASGHQRFFMGHTDKVSALAFNGSSSVLVSAQTGTVAVIRIWKYNTGECATMFKANIQSLHCLSSSQSGGVLCGVGKDGHGKQLVMVWDTSKSLKGGEVTVVAKAHTDVDIQRIRIANFDDTRMISCGRDNVRFWRVRHGNIRSCPVDLGKHQLVEITDIVFGVQTRPGMDPTHRKVYACSKNGTVYELDYFKMVVDKVHRLLPVGSRLDPKGMFGGTTPTEYGIGLNALSVNDGMCVTGSDDGFLRLWTLDFNNIILEAEHEGPVTAVDISADGLSILAGTNTGNLGYLDASSRSYTTLMRSHTATVVSFSFDSSRRRLATVSSDETIRVWCLDTLTQLFDFRAPGEEPSVIVFHPHKQCFACGFVNGSVRVFDVGKTSLLAEHKQHRGKVIGVAFSPQGDYLYSAGNKGGLILYDASSDDYGVIRMLLNTVAQGQDRGPNALAVSEDGRRVALVGPSEYTITVVDGRSLDEILRIDITSMSTDLDRSVVDKAVRVSYAPASLRQLLVMTSSSRLLKLDAFSGQLLTEVSNVHRSGCSAMTTTPDGNFLATAGDRTIKIWDYHMRLDLNFQVFIGHCSTIQDMKFSPDTLNLISVGESIMIWDFLAAGRKLDKTGGRDPAFNYLTEKPDTSVLVTKPEKPYSSEPSNETPRSLAPVPMPYKPVPVNMSPEERTSHSNTEQHDSDHGHQMAHNNSSTARGRHVAEQDDSILLSPIKVFPTSQAVTADQLSHEPSVTTTHEEPQVNKHYRCRERTSCLAQRRYTAPPNQAGLKLHSVIGYNGDGRGNLIWHQETALFVYTSGCNIVIENLSAGTQRQLLGHSEEVSCLALQHDGLVLASAAGASEHVSSQICIWGVQAGLCKKVLSYHSSQVQCLAFSRDDRFLISVGDYKECSVIVWSTRDWAVLTASSAPHPIHELRWDPFTVNEFSSVGQDGSVIFWLLDETKGTIVLNVHEADVPEDLLVSASTDEVCHFTALHYAGDSILYIGNNQGVLSAWDTRQNKCFMHWEADTCEIDIIISHCGRLITGSCSGSLRLWSVVGVAEMRLPGEDNRVPVDGLIMEDEMILDGAVVTASFDDALEMGIAGTSSDTLWYINWVERTSIRLVSSHTQQINSLVFSGPDDMFFASSGDDGSLRLWTSQQFEQTLQFQVIDQTCNCVAFCPVPAAPPIRSVTNEGQTVATVHPQAKPVEKPTRPSHCAAGYSDGTVRLFDLGKVEMIMKMQPHAVFVTAVAFSADGRVIISGGSDGLLAISSPATGLTVRVLNDHKGAPITDIQVTHNKDQQFPIPSPLLWLAASADRRVSVWSADWSKDFCELVDWLTFPAPACAPDGTPLSNNDPSQYELLPPSLARFSPLEPDIIVYTGYGMQKQVLFYSLSQRTVVRTATLTHWVTTMDISPNGSLVALGTEDRLVKLMDYYEGSFQDFVGHCDGIKRVTFTPSGKALYTVGYSDILVWNVLV